MNAQLALALPVEAASNTVVINARCSLRVEEDQRVIVVAGLPVHHYRAEDAVAEAYAMVFLVESGFAQQTEVARAFARAERTVRRYQERYAQGGMGGLGRAEGWRRGRRRIRSKRLRGIERLKSEGLSNRAIAQRLGVNERAIRKLVGVRSPYRPSSSAWPRSRAQRRAIAPSIGCSPIWGCSMMPHRCSATARRSPSRGAARPAGAARKRAVAHQPQALR